MKLFLKANNIAKYPIILIGIAIINNNIDDKIILFNTEINTMINREPKHVENMSCFLISMIIKYFACLKQIIKTQI